MKIRVPEDVKRKRFQRLIGSTEFIGAEINKTYEGKTVEVLVEGKSRNNDAMYTGRIRNYVC